MICVNSVKVTPESVTLKAGQWYYNARAEVCPLDAECRSVRWYSNNTSVATVNATTGYIYAVKAGSAKIYAEATDGSGEKDYITVNVTSGPIYVDSVTLSRSSISLEEGDSYTLYANVFPSNADNRTIAWSSSNENIAEVSNGTITAKTAGTAYIYARATDGSEKYAQCQVTVTEEVLVTSVSVSPARKTMTVGDTAYLHEIVCPPDADNKEVVWSSSDLSVVTVNYSNGFIMAVKEGVANVYATAADGSGRSGVCEITVEPTVRVESVMIYTQVPEIMYIGDVLTLQAIVCPGDATNQTITWSSSDEEVAEVGMYTGELIAKSVGTVTITATSADGRHTDSRTITVWLDTVIIRRDGDFNKIVFEHAGKEWFCLNTDMIFDYDNSVDPVLTKRALYNILKNVVEPEPGSMTNPVQDTSWGNIQTFTDDEIKLLYAIDPHGVAYYVQQTAEYLYNDLSDILPYKDYFFRLLYNREPNYFARFITGDWYITEDKSDLLKVLSESEEVFGGHNIYDFTTALELAGVVVSIIGFVFGTNFFTTGPIKLCIRKAVLATVRVLTVGEAIVRGELASALMDEAIERAFQKFNFKWALDLVSMFNSMGEALKSIVDSPDLPNYYYEIMNYCAHDSKYLVYAEFQNIEKYKLEDICTAIDNYNNYN